DEEAVTAVNFCGVVRTGRVHDDERFMKSADSFGICHEKEAFEFPLAWSEVVVIEANGLNVPKGIMKENHAPAVDGLIPNDAGIAADAGALFVFLPLQNETAADPRMRNGEAVG